MTPEVITLFPEQRCLEALHYLKRHHIRRAPVLENNQLVGMISERDLYRVLPRTLWQSTQEGEASINISVKDVMTTHVHVLSPNDHLEMAAFLMLKHKIGAMPVVKEGQIKGLITESDIFKAIWSILSYKTSYRILFFDKGNDTDKAPNDYIELCLKHHCQVHTFLSYPKPDGGYMHYLCIQGAGGDNLIKDLWSHSCEVIIVERDVNTKD
ncbi:MAG: CBS domain-containing protein [Nitrospirae bacterium]|nr:CBS domain-containing protein [Nitrospirota bacterium]